MWSPPLCCCRRGRLPSCPFICSCDSAAPSGRHPPPAESPRSRPAYPFGRAVATGRGSRRRGSLYIKFAFNYKNREGPLSTRKPRARKPAARYSAPALEKGLDVLELLAAEAHGLNLQEIARRLDRSPNELFRMLDVMV